MELYRQVDVAAKAGVGVSSVNYHGLRGYIPRPTVAIGRQLFYDRAGLETCLKFYETWRPWIRAEVSG